MRGLFSRRIKSGSADLLMSELYSEKTFYKALTQDLNACTVGAVIESPFITSNRVASLLPIFRKMRSRNVRITLITRDPDDHNFPFNLQAKQAIEILLDLGVKVVYMGGHHRKLVLIDGCLLWEGSLNILSQNDSCEIMRRIESEE